MFSGSTTPVLGTAAPAPAVAPPVSAPAPAEKHEARIGLHTELSQRVVPAGTESTVVARVRIQPDRHDDVPQPPVSVALVLDTSGSMAGEAIEEAKQAALSFVDALDARDRVSLVAFASATQTLVPLTPLDDGGRKTMREAIRGLEAVGTTELAGGLGAGLTEVRKGLAEGGAARVVLLSDGRPNDAQTIFPQLQVAAQQGITVTALGLGLEYDEELLGKIATTTGGGFHFAESPDALAEIFRDEVLALQRVVGRNAMLSVVPGPGVTIERVLGPAASFGGRTFNANLGDLVEGRTRDVFVLLRMTGHRAGAPIELLDAHLSFHDALAQQGRTVRTYVASTASASSHDVDASHDRDVELHTARALAADDALRALALARGGQLRQAKKLMGVAIKRAKQDAARFEDEVLRVKLGELADLRKALPALAPPPMRPHARRVALEPDISAVRAAKANHAGAMGALGY
jgi:Ca-activated chloride channel family protein